MFTNPHLACKLAHERQRDMLTKAEHQRLARQLRDLARASRRPARAQRWMTRALKCGRPAALPS